MATDILMIVHIDEDVTNEDIEEKLITLPLDTFSPEGKGHEMLHFQCKPCEDDD